MLRPYSATQSTVAPMTHPRRVLHVLEATIGGTKRHLLELAPGLRALGWDVEITAPRLRSASHGDVSFWDDMRAAGVPLHELPMRRATLSAANAAAAWRLARLIRTGGYAIVHAHSSVAGAVARPATLLSRLPAPPLPRAAPHHSSLTTHHSSLITHHSSLITHYSSPKLVYTPHGYAFLNPGSAARRGLYLAVEQALGRLTDRLIALSPTEAEATLANHIVPPARLATIPLGIDPAALPTDAEARQVRQRQGWGDAPVVATISRMTPQKDPLTRLRTAKIVADARPDVRFVWIWGGEMEAEVHAEAARLGLDNRIAFLGHRPDARALIAAADVFLLTSRFEGLPYSVIEALACGTPVVATDVVGTRDLIRHGTTGLLAPPATPPALAAHILHLVAHPTDAHRLAAAGQADALTRFSIRAMIDQTAHLYEDLLA
jgi:glycosyltransferase involved in cell wall biosynthesis